jgi:glucan phosphoethanolaminetransferase (alkaline phosphatase superfamily)
MFFLVSLGFTLLLLGLRLIYLWISLRKTKQENLKNSGLSIMVLGLLAGILVLIFKFASDISIDDLKAFSNIALAIVFTGSVIAIQGQIQQKPHQINTLRWWILGTIILGLGCIIAYVLLNK